MELPITLD